MLDLIVEILGKAVRGVSWPLECKEAGRWCYDWGRVRRCGGWAETESLG